MSPNPQNPADAARLRTVEPAEAAPPRAEPKATPPGAGRRRAFRVVAVALVAGALAFGAHVVLTRGEETTDDAQVEADVVPLAARTGGLVKHVLVADNQTVNAGDVLLVIDDADHAARVKQAQADLAAARAALAQAQAQEQVATASARGGLSSAQATVSGSSAGVASANAQIQAARAALERAIAEAKQTQTDLQRAKALRQENAIAQAALDQAVAANDTAQAAVDQARANLAAAEEARRVAESRIAEAQGKLAQSTPIDAQIAAAHSQTELAAARVTSSEAQLALAQNQLDYTRVVAPQAGQVSRLAVHAGQLIVAGQPIAELVPAQTYVVANFKETQIGDMRPGDRAEIDVDAFPHRTLEGRVDSLSGGTGARFAVLPPDNASGSFVKVVQRVPVRIVWTRPPDLPLRAGLSCNVTVFVSGK